MGGKTDDQVQWIDGDAYERFMGRWSRLAGVQFISWLGVPTGLDWLDVGCGTGAFGDRAPGRGVIGRSWCELDFGSGHVLRPPRCASAWPVDHR
jgi:hypothetical protein